MNNFNHRSATDDQMKMMVMSKTDNITTSQLVKGLYADTNYDGIMAADVWQNMNWQEKRHKQRKDLAYLLIPVGVLSLYNLSRFGALSRNGKFLAIGGITYSSIIWSNYRHNKHIVGHAENVINGNAPTSEEEKKAE